MCGWRAKPDSCKAMAVGQKRVSPEILFIQAGCLLLLGKNKHCRYINSATSYYFFRETLLQFFKQKHVYLFIMHSYFFSFQNTHKLCVSYSQTRHGRDTIHQSTQVYINGLGSSISHLHNLYKCHLPSLNFLDRSSELLQCLCLVQLGLISVFSVSCFCVCVYCKVGVPNSVGVSVLV